jgi:hypothetical protein
MFAKPIAKRFVDDALSGVGRLPLQFLPQAGIL